ncbi:hypothetical protein R1flu_022834 [Riccia fluitans]|uniref:Uncharacterized protein n=1 Tax=Riccia fluitans TaxID=41844 RepID=A0ABD1XQF7_9MARC
MAEPRKLAGKIGTSIVGAQVEDTCGSKHPNPRRKRRIRRLHLGRERNEELDQLTVRGEDCRWLQLNSQLRKKTLGSVTSYLSFRSSAVQNSEVSELENSQIRRVKLSARELLSPQSTVGCPFHFNFRRADLKKPQFASSVSTRSESAQNVPVSDPSAIRLSFTPETPTHELVLVQFRAFRPRERGVGIAPERFRRRREPERERRLCDPRRLPNKLR